MVTSVRALALPVAAMTLVVVASNILVQHPFGLCGLQDHLTWGAFTYPVSFLVTDITNRRYGVTAARKLVGIGFVIAVALSVVLATPRIAMASGTAFLVGQLLDVTVFDGLRRQAWWRAPLMGSLVGSVLDTALFFSIAFAGLADMSVTVSFLGVAAMPLWVSLALSDLIVKVLIALLALLPYGALLTVVKPAEIVQPAR